MVCKFKKKMNDYHDFFLITVKMVKIEFPVKLPIRIVYDGPNPPIFPISTQNCLVVGP